MNVPSLGLKLREFHALESYQVKLYQSQLTD